MAVAGAERSPRPVPLPVIFENIPGDLRYLNQWVLWRYVWKDDKAKWDKPPFQPNGKLASSTAKHTWSSYQGVKAAYERGLSLPADDPLHFDGVGFVPVKVNQAENNLQLGDLDKCRNKETGELSLEAREDLDLINSYAEVSPSGTGIRFMAKGAPPYSQAKDGCKNGGIELYQARHYLTITGHRLEEYPATIETRIGELTEFYLKHFSKSESSTPNQRQQDPSLTDDQIICLASEAANSKKFMALMGGDISGYPSQSEADQALCNILAFYTISKGQIDSIFRRSGLYREKWGRSDYRESTIGKALNDAREHYSGSGSMEAGEPHIRMVSIDKNPGSVGLDKDGCIKSVECEKDGKKTLKWLSDCALHIHTETSAKDSTEFTFKGVGAKDHRPVSFTLPASALADPRKFRGALINAFGAKNRAGKLDFETVQRLTRDTRLLKRVEVPAWGGNMPLLPGVDLAANVEYKISSKIPATVYDGDLQAAKDCLRKLLKVHKFAPLLVAAAMGAPAVARWHKNDRFGLGLWGSTGSLKTSTALAALGIYGIGYLDGPKLKAGKGGSTTVGALEVFAAAGFLPQIYDDVKTVDSKDSAAYVVTVHAVLEGEEKTRGKRDGGLRESREFLCTPIITGEVRPSEASTSARVFNLNWTRSDDKLLGEVQQNAALLPVIGYHWLRFLAETDFVLGKDFDAFRSKKMQDFLGLQYTNPGRLATIYTLLISLWDVLQASPLGDVFAEARESFKVALLEATAAQGAAVTEETEISRFLVGLEELLASNPGIVMSEDGVKTIAGSIIGKRMPDGLFLLPTETLNELMKIRAFTQQPTIDSITQGLNEMGKLTPDPDGKHLKYRMRFNGGRPWGWYIRDVAPPKEELSPPSGDAKNDGKRHYVPTVPTVPKVDEREKKSKDFQKNHDRLSNEKQFHQKGGDSGDSRDSSIVNRLVDSDFDSKVSVPTSVPTEKLCGDTSKGCGEEQPAPGDGAALPPDSVEKGDTSEKIRVAALMEYGYNGEVDPVKVAGKLHISLDEATAWLDANYVRLERLSGVVRYTQRRAAEAGA